MDMTQLPKPEGIDMKGVAKHPGMGALQLTAPQQKKLIINKLQPPETARQHIISKDTERTSKNPIKRFWRTFFLGDGY